MICLHVRARSMGSRSTLLAIAGSLAVVGQLGGCAGDLATMSDGTSMNTPREGVTVDGQFTFSERAAGEILVQVDASNEEKWRYLELDEQKAVDEQNKGWDLAFKRYRVQTNGGVSGPGGVQVAALVERAFDKVEKAPDDGWSVDQPDGPDMDNEVDNVFTNGVDKNGTGSWYAYDPMTHTLSPEDVTYAIMSTGSHFYKLRFEGYYDEAGTSGWPSFVFARIDAPSKGKPSPVKPAKPAMPTPSKPSTPTTPADPIPADAVTVEAGDRTKWVYWSVKDGLVTPKDPAADKGWDLAFLRTKVRTNSGTSGPGMGGAKEDESMGTFEELRASSTIGFEVDSTSEGDRPGTEPTSVNPVLGTWFDYDASTHKVSPKKQTYVLRTADGGYAKLRVWEWKDGVYQLSVNAVERRVEPVEVELDASMRGTWTYFSVGKAAKVEPSEPMTSEAWDLAISRTRMRTNGGTSGPGMGQAALTTATMIAALQMVPSMGWTPDEVAKASDPSAMAESANPVLAEWFDYDVSTHKVSPRESVFALRTASGDAAALQVLSYDDGRYKLRIVYAGPGQESF